MNMKKSLLVFLLLTSASTTSPQSKQQPSIVGTWKMMSFENYRPDGTVGRPFGDKPAGYFFYDSAGHLSIHLMRTPPLPNFPGATNASGDAEKFREVYQAYVGYFGTYSVDYAKGILVHHVEGSNRPDYTGSNEIRPFRIEGNRLIIEIRERGQVRRRELVRVN